MKQVQNEVGRIQGERLVERLKSGAFKKDSRPNHGIDFTEGLEGLYKYRFSTYLGSSSCFLLEQKLKINGCEYYG